MKTNFETRGARTARTTSWTAVLAIVAGLGGTRMARADGLPDVPPPSPAPAWSPFASPGAPPAGPMGAPPAPAPAPGPNDPQAPQVRRLTPAQLQELVGPIALYPDVVLSALLPATAFPLDVIGAARFAREHKNAPAAAPAEAGWDASVQALLQFPDVLFWLDENIPWLQQMGEAVATQQADVLAAVQEFRRRADAAGNLPTNDKQRVIVRAPAEPAAPQVIVIEPTNPEICYVPVYDPVVVCQPSPWWGIGSCMTWGLGFSFGFGGPWACNDFEWWGWNGYHNGYCGSIRSYGAPYRWHGGAPHYASGLYGPRVWNAPSGVYGTGSARHYGGGAYAPTAGGAALAGGSPRLTVRTPTRPTWGGGGSAVLRSGTDVAAPRVSAYAPRTGGAGLGAGTGAEGPAFHAPRTTRPAPTADLGAASAFRTTGGAPGDAAVRGAGRSPFGAGPVSATATGGQGVDRGARAWSRGDIPRRGTFGANGSGAATSGGSFGSGPTSSPAAATPQVAGSQTSRTTRAWDGGGNVWNGNAIPKVNGGAPAGTTYRAPAAPTRSWQSTPRVERSTPQAIPSAPAFRSTTPAAPKWSAPSSPSQPSFRSSSSGGNGGWGRQSHGNDDSPPPPPPSSRRR